MASPGYKVVSHLHMKTLMLILIFLKREWNKNLELLLELMDSSLFKLLPLPPRELSGIPTFYCEEQGCRRAFPLTSKTYL